MALSIKDTPVLTGKDAAYFAEKAKNAHLHPVSKKSYLRAKKIYEEIKKKYPDF
jgi:hypothetical protein